MTRDEALKAIDELVDLPSETLKGPEKLEDVEGWNSMAMIGVIALADENGVTLSPRQIAGCTTINDVLALMKAEG
jgi:acyl carrier protein